MTLDDHFHSPRRKSLSFLHALFAVLMPVWVIFVGRWLWQADKNGTEFFAITMGLLGLFILSALWYRFWWLRLASLRRWMEATVSGFWRGIISGGVLAAVAIFFIEMFGGRSGALIFNIYIRLEDFAALAAGIAYWYQHLEYGKEQTKPYDENQSDEK